MNKVAWIAVAALAMPLAVYAQKAAPMGEEDKGSTPAETSTKGKPVSAPEKYTPEQQKKLEATGNETRDAVVPKYHKKTAEEKAKAKAERKAKQKEATPEKEQQAEKNQSGG